MLWDLSHWVCHKVTITWRRAALIIACFLDITSEATGEEWPPEEQTEFQEGGAEVEDYLNELDDSELLAYDEMFPSWS